MSKIKKLFWFAWKLYLGALFCQTALTSLLVVGWTYRFVQQTVRQQWRVLSSSESHDRHATNQAWPAWFISQSENSTFGAKLKANSAGPKKIRGLFHTVFGSLGLNLKIGFLGALNTMILILPPSVFWLFAWYDGWNNSFTKGYEQAFVAPATGVFGVVLFLAVMLYIPMAQIRQAATGQWWTFFQFTIIRKLVRKNLRTSMVLAGVYAGAGFPFYLLRLVLLGLGQNQSMADLSDSELLSFLSSYFIWASVFLFPAYVFVRWIAARIYAKALVALVQDGDLKAADLETQEREELRALGLLEIRTKSKRHVLIEAAGWAGTRFGRMASTAIALVFWFLVVAQIFAAQFFNHLPVQGWLNQPLIQVPWYRYIPSHLQQPSPAKSMENAQKD